MNWREVLEARRRGLLPGFIGADESLEAYKARIEKTAPAKTTSGHNPAGVA